MRVITLFLVLALAAVASSFSFSSRVSNIARSRSLAMGAFMDGVSFNTIAREWRFKWNADDDKKSLASAQQTLSLFQQAIKNVDGVKSVQRIICGGCLDFKVIVALDEGKFGAWVSAKDKAFRIRIPS